MHLWPGVTTRRIPGFVWITLSLSFSWRFQRDTMVSGIVQRRRIGPVTVVWIPEDEPGHRRRVLLEKRAREAARRAAA